MAGLWRESEWQKQDLFWCLLRTERAKFSHFKTDLGFRIFKTKNSFFSPNKEPLVNNTPDSRDKERSIYEAWASSTVSQDSDQKGTVPVAPWNGPDLPRLPKDGKTKTSANQKYTVVTAACLTRYILDDLTVSASPPPPPAMLKGTCTLLSGSVPFWAGVQLCICW